MFPRGRCTVSDCIIDRGASCIAQKRHRHHLLSSNAPSPSRRYRTQVAVSVITSTIVANSTIVIMLQCRSRRVNVMATVFVSILYRSRIGGHILVIVGIYCLFRGGRTNNQTS